MCLMKNKVPEITGINCFDRADETSVKFYGVLEKSFRFIERNQICDVNLWRKFVNLFRMNLDDDLGWRCEYWGKMMRGACMVVQYTKDDGFYKILENSVRDLLTTQDNLGRIATYSVEKEFNAWDLWGRKYVMLGLEYFLEICRDEKLCEDILSALCRHADYILDHIGAEDGKTEICKATGNWLGLNSCSILEPMLRLYRLTGEKRYLSFGEYIVSTGFIDGGNLIDLAFENEIAPHEYPVDKAYEMISCFEGLLHYCRITGEKKHKTALLNFGKRIIDGELSIIGCSGCTHELFDHTAIKQTQTDYDGVVQETCVTVTWMRFALGLLELTGDVAFADAIEQSFYNSYLGSFNTERVPFRRYPQMDDVPQIMPFDSYSPLTANQRGLDVGGYQLFPDGSFYGCCACIAAAGSGVMPRFAFLKSNKGFVINFYEKSQIKTRTPSGKDIAFTMSTEYPVSGRADIALSLTEDEVFELKFRIPQWCGKASVSVNGEERSFTSGYATIERLWRNGDTVTVTMNMDVKKILPPDGAVNRELFAAYRRGPIVLAADARLADPYSVIDIECDENATVKSELAACGEIPDARLCVELRTVEGESVRLIDYSSAGKTWSEDSACAVWVYRK